jgi:hypothetical protein
MNYANLHDSGKSGAHARVSWRLKCIHASNCIECWGIKFHWMCAIESHSRQAHKWMDTIKLHWMLGNQNCTGCKNEEILQPCTQHPGHCVVANLRFISRISLLDAHLFKARAGEATAGWIYSNLLTALHPYNNYVTWRPADKSSS